MIGSINYTRFPSVENVVGEGRSEWKLLSAFLISVYVFLRHSPTIAPGRETSRETQMRQ